MTVQIVQRPAHPSNFRTGRALGAPRVIVIHTMQGTAEGTASWFAQDHHAAGIAPSSAHYGISKLGQVMQFVREEDTAWHAGHAETNSLSIGIELEGDCYDPHNFTEPMMLAAIELGHAICDRYGIPASRVTVFGHMDVIDGRPGHQGEKGGAGHHVDPGPHFDFVRFLAALSGSIPTT